MLTPWRLIYPGTDLRFGPRATGLPISEAPSFGPADLTIDDRTLGEARSDGTGFGSDFRGGTTISFALHAIGDTQDQSRDLAGAYLAAWRGDRVRATPGALAELRTPSGRSVFGRPRRAVLDEALARFGKYFIQADFVTADDLWYGRQEQLSVPLRLSQSGGFVLPLRLPMVARGYTTAANVFTVAGEVDSWPIVTIKGPILNPTVEVPGCFRFSAGTSLQYDETLRIDARPGRQTVLRNGSKIAALTRTSTLLPAAALPPGAHTLTLSGSSSTGSPTAQIAWRPAYTTP